jgi:hypothetical protein
MALDYLCANAKSSKQGVGPLNKETRLTEVNFSSCQRNLIKTFQIEGMIALITKMTLIFFSGLLKGQK